MLFMSSASLHRRFRGRNLCVLFFFVFVFLWCWPFVSERSLCEGLFHEFKKHGEVKQVNVHEENGSRIAVVEFKK